MLVIPAIDLAGGKAVRLRGGRREEMTVYHHRPWELCRAFVAAGATRLHVVDLDGAFGGGPGGPNRGALERVMAEATVPIALGGGLRDDAAARFAGAPDFAA